MLSGDISIKSFGPTNQYLMIYGSGVSIELFTFLACNTGVEWMYASCSGSAEARLMTSNMPHEVEFLPKHVSGYDTLSHNHGQQDFPSGSWTFEDWMEYVGLPSNSDIIMLSGAGLSKGRIYNKINGNWTEFTTETTNTQDNYKH